MTIDVLTNVLENAQIDTSVHFHSAVTAPWGISIASERRGMMHAHRSRPGHSKRWPPDEYRHRPSENAA